VVLAASPDAILRPGDRLPWDATISSRLVARSAPVVAGTLVGTAYARFEAPGVRAYPGTPLTDLAGGVVGSLSGVDGRRRHDLGRHCDTVAVHARSLSQLLAQQRRLDAQARSLERLPDAAETDALTGLANRRAWERALRVEQERLDLHRTQGAVIIIDLDGLKRANDSYGHAVGDDLLRRAADALRAATRDGDTVARLGGDEFGVLLGEATSADLAEVVLRLRRMLAAADVQASLSGAVTGHRTLVDAWELADRRMYAQKTTGNPPAGGPPGR
jgi:diguanylate cyclase (GGDEF)-like protein